MFGSWGNSFGNGKFQDFVFPQEGCHGLDTGTRSGGGWGREISELGIHRGQRGNPGPWKGLPHWVWGIENLQIEFGKEILFLIPFPALLKQPRSCFSCTCASEDLSLELLQIPPGNHFLPAVFCAIRGAVTAGEARSACPAPSLFWEHSSSWEGFLEIGQGWMCSGERPWSLISSCFFVASSPFSFWFRQNSNIYMPQINDPRQDSALFCVCRTLMWYSATFQTSTSWQWSFWDWLRTLWKWQTRAALTLWLAAALRTWQRFGV